MARARGVWCRGGTRRTLRGGRLVPGCVPVMLANSAAAAVTATQRPHGDRLGGPSDPGRGQQVLGELEKRGQPRATPWRGPCLPAMPLPRRSAASPCFPLNIPSPSCSEHAPSTGPSPQAHGKGLFSSFLELAVEQGPPGHALPSLPPVYTPPLANAPVNRHQRLKRPRPFRLVTYWPWVPSPFPKRAGSSTHPVYPAGVLPAVWPLSVLPSPLPSGP